MTASFLQLWRRTSVALIVLGGAYAPIPTEASHSNLAEQTVTFTVEAEAFGDGGQGCWQGPFYCGGGYYDETPGNWGDAQVRPGTDVDLWYDDGGIVIGGLDGLEWVTFPVTVPQSGRYLVTFRTASPADRPAGSGVVNVGIYGVDESWIGNQIVPVTGGAGEWHQYRSWQAPATVYLPAGEQTLTMWAGGGYYNVRNMTFTLEESLEPIVPGQLNPIVLSGTVIDEDGTPVPGARVRMTFLMSTGPGAHWSYASAVADARGAYEVDFSALAGAMSGPAGTENAIAFAEIDPDCASPLFCPYVSDFRYIVVKTQRAIQNFSLHRVVRVSVGDFTVVTVAPDDPICDNNVQDSHPWPEEFVCRTVRVVAPSDGVVKVEASPLQAGATPPGLEVETVFDPSGGCCSERLGNPTLISVAAGTELMVNVEVPWGSIGAQSFIVKTSLPESLATLWGMVLGPAGICIEGGAVEVVGGQRLGETITQTTPCGPWDVDGGFLFTGLIPGVEMTLRASAPGWSTQEKTFVPQAGPYQAVFLTLSERQ